MYPSAMIQEIAYARAAELHRSAARSRGARAVALAARQQDVLARRRLGGLLPDRPIVTAKPIRPRVAAPQPAAAARPAAEPAAAGAASPASTGAAGNSGAPVAVLTPCTTC